ncbi:MAG: DUF362 domain-containing protein [Synergistaceae bacterium]|jgi:uncharacterized protein (DUF362 family)/Pyruvate/2-oxoacid:ferredoxin oxidoreductase delta subunit|nr:DUF362 domain-containing protein [Synergistaceae bacterium]
MSGPVLIKTNALSPSPPEEAVTTHPRVIEGIAQEIERRTSGMDVSVRVADSPGYLFTDSGLLFEVTGLANLASLPRVSVGPLSDLGTRMIAGDGFSVLPDARISARYLDAAYRINAPKLKTHVETEMSGCIKNIFGTADTETRKKAHRSSSQKRLADAIVDIFSVRPPEFNIADAVVGMEGDGPSHGTPRLTGMIVAGQNALAVDWVLCRMMCYGDPASIPLIKAAIDRGIGPASESEIVLNGADWDELPVAGFKKSTRALRALPTIIRGLAHGLVKITPVLDESQCAKCWICESVCPVNAISRTGAYPRIDRKKCVRCLCCHEMCPKGAMTVRKNLLASLVSGTRR